MDDLTVETRLRFQPSAEPPPEGWVQGAQWFLEDGTLDVVYIRPEAYGHTPYSDEDRVYVNFRPVTQRRTVSEWQDMPGC